MLKTKLQTAGMFLVGSMLLVGGYGFVYTGSQSGDVFRKVGQTIETVPSTLQLKLNSFKVDSTNGTTLTGLLAGTCDLIGMDVSQTATTSAAYDCAVTGAAAGDIVLATMSTSSPTAHVFHGWRILGVNASSTAGFITLHIWNGTGANAVPSATGVGSSTPYAVLAL